MIRGGGHGLLSRQAQDNKLYPHAYSCHNHMYKRSTSTTQSSLGVHSSILNIMRGVAKVMTKHEVQSICNGSKTNPTCTCTCI